MNIAVELKKIPSSVAAAVVVALVVAVAVELARLQ